MDLEWIALIAAVIAAFVYLGSKVHGHRPPRDYADRREARRSNDRGGGWFGGGGFGGGGGDGGEYE